MYKIVQLFRNAEFQITIVFCSYILIKYYLSNSEATFFLFVFVVGGVCFQICIVVIIVLLLLFFFFDRLFSFLEGSAVFISVWVGAGWSYNHLLVRKSTFLILELYINLKCSREIWLQLDNYLLFYIFQVYFHIDHVCACASVCLSLYLCVSMLPCKWV